MHHKIRELIYSNTLQHLTGADKKELLDSLDQLVHAAFIDHHEESVVQAHRILYQINLAHLAKAWEESPKQVNHPLIATIKYNIEESWENSLQSKEDKLLEVVPTISTFKHWLKDYANNRVGKHLHPAFQYMQDHASFNQMREFIFQESPLELLFGDILAMMLPGVYGPIKIEYLHNYWDEVGHAEPGLAHPELRMKLMDKFNLPSKCHIELADALISEELQLINLYLSLATNRSKHLQLIGVMLATEQMIPGQFGYLINGCKRLGLTDDDMIYLQLHTTIDEIHAENWLSHVVMPILQQSPSSISDILFGMNRRFNASENVLNRLYEKMKSMHEQPMEAVLAYA